MTSNNHVAFLNEEDQRAIQKKASYYKAHGLKLNGSVYDCVGLYNQPSFPLAPRNSLCQLFPLSLLLLRSYPSIPLEKKKSIVDHFCGLWHRDGTYTSYDLPDGRCRSAENHAGLALPDHLISRREW